MSSTVENKKLSRKTRWRLRNNQRKRLQTERKFVFDKDRAERNGFPPYPQLKPFHHRYQGLVQQQALKFLEKFLKYCPYNKCLENQLCNWCGPVFEKERRMRQTEKETREREREQARDALLIVKTEQARLRELRRKAELRLLRSKQCTRCLLSKSGLCEIRREDIILAENKLIKEVLREEKLNKNIN